MISLQFFSNCSLLLLFQINKARFFFIFHESWRKLVKWNWKTTSGMQKKQKSKRTYCMKLINATKVSRRRNGSFTHILRFLHFSNETLHKITVWKIETTNSNNRVSSSKFIITCWCYRSNVLLRKKVFSRFNFITFLSSLLHFRELYYNSTINEARNSPVTKSSYETEGRKMTSYFKLLTQNFLQKFFFLVRVTISKV